MDPLSRFAGFQKSSVCQPSKHFLHSRPHRRSGIDNLKMPNTGQRNQLHFLPRLLLALGIALADFVRHGIVSGSVNQLLRGLRNRLLCRRGFAVVIRNLTWRSAQELGDGIVAQVQLPTASKIENAGERQDSSYRLLKPSQTERKLSSRGVSGNAEPVHVELGGAFAMMFSQRVEGPANVLERP